MRKILMIFAVMLAGLSAATAQAIYGPTTVCMNKSIDGSPAQPYGTAMFTVNHPLLCRYCGEAGYQVNITDNGRATTYDTHSNCSLFGPVVDRISNVEIVFKGEGVHHIVVGWYDCGVAGIGTQAAASIDVTVTDGNTYLSTALTGATINTAIYPEPYTCNPSGLVLNTSFINKCASSGNATASLFRFNTITNNWGPPIANTPIYGGNYTGFVGTMFGGAFVNGTLSGGLYKIETGGGSAPLTQTGKTITFRVVDGTAQSVNFRLLARDGLTKRDIPNPPDCTNPMPVHRLNAPRITGIANSTGTLDKYWIRVFDANTTCSAVNMPLLLDGNLPSSSGISLRRALPCGNLTCLTQDLNDYYYDIRTAQGVANVPTSFFSEPANRDKRYRIEVWGENACTGSVGRRQVVNIINNSVLGTQRLSKTGAPDDDLIEIESIELTPNPTAGSVSLSYQVSEDLASNFVVYNIQGQEVFNRPVHLGKGDGSVSFDVSALPQGMYIYRVGSFTNKFVKE